MSVVDHGSGSSRRPSNSRPAAPNRSETGTGWPNVMRVAWIRFLSAVRCLTRWSRKRALSRSRGRRVGQPDRRHEVAPGKLGEHARVDLVGLGRQRCERLGLGRVGQLDVPTTQLQLVMDEPAAGHRFDDRRHLPVIQRDLADEPAQARPGGRHPGRGHRLARLVEHVDDELLARIGDRPRALRRRRGLAMAWESSLRKEDARRADGSEMSAARPTRCSAMPAARPGRSA